MEEKEDRNDIDYVYVSELRVGSHIVYNDRPCKITSMTKTKTGKHGAAKAIMNARDIFNDNKYVFSFSTADKVAVPIVTKKTYSLVGLNDGYFSLLGEDGLLDNSMKCLDDNELCQQIKVNYENSKNVDVNVTCALGESQISSFVVTE
jgi:translation initiation factor 5A